MKNHYSLLVLGALLVLNVFVSCDNSLDLVDDGGDVPIVYSLLTATSNTQYVRLEKGFIDPFMSAEEVAQIADSIYYSDAEVSLINLESNDTFLFEKFNAKDLGYVRDEGFFLRDPNYIYRYQGVDSDFSPGAKVRLEIDRGEGFDVVFSEINMLDTIVIISPKSNKQIGFPDETDFSIKWFIDPLKNSSEYYSIKLHLYYNESDTSVEEPEFEGKKLIWNFGNFVGTNKAKTPGTDLYKFFAKELDIDSKYVRTFEYFDIEIIYSGQEMKKYKDFLSANSGITSSQPFPPYSNLSEGLGLVAERNTQWLRNVFLNELTLDSLSMGRFSYNLGFL